MPVFKLYRAEIALQSPYVQRVANLGQEITSCRNNSAHLAAHGETLSRSDNIGGSNVVFGPLVRRFSPRSHVSLGLAHVRSLPSRLVRITT